MKIGSLFTGIGGLDRGVEAAIPGTRVAWQAENNPQARAVLAHHYPGVPCYANVREIDERSERVDIICGGFPCQDISSAGKRAGIDGERSGLWREYARIVRVLRPDLVFVENVAAILGRGLERVLGDLAACGYDAVWETFRAVDVGAPHLRDRLFILAYADGKKWRSAARDVDSAQDTRADRRDENARDAPNVADPDSPGQHPVGLGGLPEVAVAQPGRHADRCDCPRCYVHVFPPGPDQIEGWPGPQPAIRQCHDGSARGLDGAVDGTNTKRGPTEDLRALRESVHEGSLQRSLGRRVALCEADLLFKGVLGARSTAGGAIAFSNAEANRQEPEAVLREVRRAVASQQSPQGSQLAEQRSLELGNALLILSHLVAPRRERHQSINASTAVFCLWKAVVSARALRNPPHSLQEVWRPANDEEASRWILAASLGYLGVHKGDRLRLLGNAVVPQQATLAFLTLLRAVG